MLTAALLLGAAFAVTAAGAATIVALGASNAAGQGVGADQAWPAQLERMLRAKGYNVNVVVNAVRGDTSAGILSRVDSAVPAGTRAVVFDTGISNDRRKGVSPAESQANIAQIRARIRAHGALPVMTSYAGVPSQDGVHSTVAGHQMIAARLVPQVSGVLKGR
jgi:acyl-CoA thioesterase-1